MNQAIHFKNSGHDTSFIGALGKDKSGDQIIEFIKSQHIDTSHTYRLDGKTAGNQIVNDEHGERFGIEGAWHGGVYETFKMYDSDWKHIDTFDIWATHQTSPDFLNTIQRKKDHHFLCVDFLHLEDWEQLRKTIEKIDIAYIGGTEDMIDGLADIASNRTKNLIVLTLGNKGSMAFQEKQVWAQKALPVQKILDTTGCGDAFQAGFTASYFQNRNVPEALKAGAELGRNTTKHYGGIDSKISIIN